MACVSLTCQKISQVGSHFYVYLMTTSIELSRFQTLKPLVSRRPLYPEAIEADTKVNTQLIILNRASEILVGIHHFILLFFNYYF